MPLALSEPQVVIPNRVHRLTPLDARGRGVMSPRISSPDPAEKCFGQSFADRLPIRKEIYPNWGARL